MALLRIKAPGEQVADYLRGQILSGYYQDTMPGKTALARDLGIDPKTATLAMELLEKENLLVSQGPGRPRLIKLTKHHQPVGLKLMILCYGPQDREQPYILAIQNHLTELGHRVDFANRSLSDVNMDIGKVTRIVNQTTADAWLVVSGSLEILNWFSQQSTPCYALFGRARTVKIAASGVTHTDTYRDIINRLTTLGHRRIVHLSRSERRMPTPGLVERVFLEELQSHGIETSSYHLPNWDDSPEGLRDCLDSLFSLTPPTAIIVSLPDVYLSAYEHLLKMGLSAPKDISLACSLHDSVLSWMHPEVTHFQWDHKPIVQHIARWANSIALGKEDYRQRYVKSKLVEGGTIGPAPTRG